MLKIFTYCLVIYFSVNANCFAQHLSSIEDSALILPGKFYSKIEKKLTAINKHVTKKTAKYLSKFQRQEQKLQQKLQRLHPDLGFQDVTGKYKNFLQKINSKTPTIVRNASGEYLPYVDSLATSLSFLKQFNGISDKVTGPLKSFDRLLGRLQQTEMIKAFIAERRSQIKDILSKYTHLPAGLTTQFKQLNKTAYYYSAQVKEYKELLNDPDKMEQKVLAMLNQLPAFQKFVKENSALAGLFTLPGNYASTQALSGLQTRDEIAQLIRNRIGGGPNAGQLFSQQIQVAQQGLQLFKQKLQKLGGGSGDIEMPDFKANGQKTKSFGQRLDYEFNIQFARHNAILPETGDLALSIGYKLNDKKEVGLGMSYKLGVGTLEKIQFTSQGLGLRSFLDWKLKGKIYVAGGYEMNYNSGFSHINQLQQYNAWQRSALLGLSKKYSIGKKRKGEMKILYDFLANSHIPKSQPLLFRVGYSLK